MEKLGDGKCTAFIGSVNFSCFECSSPLYQTFNGFRKLPKYLLPIFWLIKFFCILEGIPGFCTGILHAQYEKMATLHGLKCNGR
jgi:hypothetical protein